jgi:hypothetical protein
MPDRTRRNGSGWSLRARQYKEPQTGLYAGRLPQELRLPELIVRFLTCSKEHELEAINSGGERSLPVTCKDPEDGCDPETHGAQTLAAVARRRLADWVRSATRSASTSPAAIGQNVH